VSVTPPEDLGAPEEETLGTSDVSGFDLATVDRLLTTTRSVRKRLDLTRPVDLRLIRECLELAVQAPTGSNAQTWRWVVVVDPEKRMALAELYRNPPEDRPHRSSGLEPALADSPQQRRVMASARFLVEHMDQVPVLVVPCVLDAGGAAGWAPSIYPAVWSFILALRSRGLGSTITTVHLYREAEAAVLLGIPEGYVQACLLPVAHYTGDDFKRAVRRPIQQVAFVDGWGNPVP
jgi:nitroreductase